MVSKLLHITGFWVEFPNTLFQPQASYFPSHSWSLSKVLSVSMGLHPTLTGQQLPPSLPCLIVTINCWKKLSFPKTKTDHFKLKDSPCEAGPLHNHRLVCVTQASSSCSLHFPEDPWKHPRWAPGCQMGIWTLLIYSKLWSDYFLIKETLLQY